MSIYDILDTVCGCYENYVPVSYRSLINTLEYYDIPFTHHVYEITHDVRTPNDCLTHKMSSCAVDINIDLYNEGSRIIINIVNDHITNIKRELTKANVFMNCTSLENLIF